ncbi:MAG: c-type cytochrome biogenesis protein CcmI [Pseudomonadota bacterium]
MFWFLAAALTIVAVLVGFAPLYKKSGEKADLAADKDFDVTVYRDQLSELDADKDRGLIGASEYEQARVEIARRVMAAEDKAAENQAAPARRDRVVGPAFALLFVPAIALLFYYEIGSPGLEAQPLAARLERASPIGGDQDIALMLERAEEHLRVNSDDVRGWDVVAPIYLRLNQSDKAASAFENAISLDGPTVERLSGLGHALVAQAGGVVNDGALQRFQAALELDPTDTRSMFFVGLAAAQGGDEAGALARWERLSVSGQNDEWAQMVGIARQQIQPETPSGAAPQIDQDAGRAISELPADEQAEMIMAMVDGLDERLADDPNDLQGWLRLIRARAALGQSDLASTALENGIDAFQDNQQAVESLRQLANELGISAVENET